MTDIVLIPLVALVGFVVGAAAMYVIATQADDRDDAFWAAQTTPTWTTTTIYDSVDARGRLPAPALPDDPDPTGPDQHPEGAQE